MMQQWILARFLGGIIAAVIASSIVIGILSLSPKHRPKIQEIAKTYSVEKNGLVEKYDFLGLLETQWNYVNGKANGEALQFYPTGSIFREMRYSDGKLIGTMREYYEKEGRRAPIRKQMMKPRDRFGIKANIKGEWTYLDGKLNGLYSLYYEDGGLKEQGEFRDDKRIGTTKYYNKTGELVKEKHHKF